MDISKDLYGNIGYISASSAPVMGTGVNADQGTGSGGSNSGSGSGAGGSGSGAGDSNPGPGSGPGVANTRFVLVDSKYHVSDPTGVAARGYINPITGRPYPTSQPYFSNLASSLEHQLEVSGRATSSLTNTHYGHVD